MRALMLCACALLSGCVDGMRQPPPASVVCPKSALALCDISSPPVPQQMAADDAIDRAIFHVAQRNECARLNAAKLACINNSGKKLMRGAK